MSEIALRAIKIFGQGVARSEGIVIGKDGYVYGAGRNGTIYKVSPDDKDAELRHWHITVFNDTLAEMQTEGG
jgi:hypothetical protein